MKIVALIFILFFCCWLVHNSYSSLANDRLQKYRILQYGNNGYKIQWIGSGVFGFSWHDVLSGPMGGYIKEFGSFEDARVEIMKRCKEDSVAIENAKIGWIVVE